MAEVDDVDFTRLRSHAVVEQVSRTAKREAPHVSESFHENGPTNFGALGNEKQACADFVTEKIGCRTAVLSPPRGSFPYLSVCLWRDDDTVKRVEGHLARSVAAQLRQKLVERDALAGIDLRDALGDGRLIIG